MFKKNILIIVALVLGVSGMFAQTKTEAKLPDTPAGKRTTALLKAVSQGDEASIRKFLEENVEERFRNAFPMEQHVAIFKRMNQAFGGGEITKVETPEPDIVEMTVKGAGDKKFQVSVQIAPGAPNLIESLNFREIKPKGAQANLLDGKPDLVAPGVVNTEIRGRIIEATLKQFNEQYVFPEVANEMDKAVRAR